MEYINIDTIEHIEVVHERVMPYYKAYYEPEHINFWGKTIPERVVVYKDEYCSVEEFLEKYGNDCFIRDQKVYEKAHIIFRFISGTIRTIFFASNEEAEEKANEITKNWNRIFIP